MTKRKVLPLALGGASLAIAAVLWFTSRPRADEAKPKVDKTPPAPLFAKTEAAKNPTRLHLQDDGRKVLGWISGTDDLAGRELQIKIEEQKEWHGTGVKVGKDNTFAWEYKLDKPAKVRFFIDTPRDVKWLDETITVTPAVAEKQPNVFFVVDRTAYRPTQVLHFAGFLRTLDAKGDFEPITNKEVVVELTSQQKQTKAAKFKLTSDELGRITGSYVFSDFDALDTYTLAIPGYKGQAQLLLGEYRKSKIKLKITGDVDGQKMNLKFETLDFLDKAVAASKLNFTAQVVQKGGGGEKTLPLKAEEFAHHVALGLGKFDPEELPEDQKLLWQAYGIPPYGGGGNVVVAQVGGDIQVKGDEPGKYTLDLKKEWGEGSYAVVVQGVVTDANGREQRATATIPLKCSTKHGVKTRLEIAKEIFAVNEKVTVRLTSEEGKPVEGTTSLVVMQLAAEPPAMQGGFYGYGYYGYDMYNDYNWRYRARRGAYVPPLRWTPTPTEQSKRSLVTALPFKGDTASVKLAEPGAYKFVAVTQQEDGTSTRTEVGCVVKHTDDMNPVILRLDRDVLRSGDQLSGSIHSRFADAIVLLTLKDSSGLRFWKPIRLKDGSARFDEKLPGDLRYGVGVEVIYPDENEIAHITGRFIRVNPVDRMIGLTATTKPEVAPGENVKIDIQADRKEEVDLVVSVYDQSLLGIAPDKSVDIRNFYLADERVRTKLTGDVLRRKLGGATVKSMVDRAEAQLKEDDKLRTSPAGQAMQNFVNMVKSHNQITTNELMTMLRLAGVEITLDPAWAAYAGIGNWRVHFDPKKPTPRVADLIDQRMEGNQYYLVWEQMGEVIVLHEMHPSYANTNPWAMGYGRYYGRGGGMYLNNGGFGYQSGPMFENFRGSARGDSHLSISGNSSGSFMPEAQGFISHLPPGGPGAGPVPLIGTDSDQGHIGVRRDFSDSAFWKADVRTDKDGKASVEFKVPDSLTNWQVVVTAVSKKMHVGHTKSQFRTFKPIMVWPMLPRVFTEGDRVEVFASVHNRTDEQQTIKVRLKVENGEVLTAEEKTVQVPAKGNVPVYWSFQARQPGFTQLLMTADCAAGSDASLKRLPVNRCSAEEVVTKSGQVRDGATFTIPQGIDLSNARLEVNFAPSLAADLADTLNYLVEYPYGCVEQTMSRFLPAIKVAQVLKTYQVEHAELNKKLPGCVAGGIKRLLELQQPDGGWGWNGSSATHEMMTPYALYGLLQAEKAGYVIPNEQAIQRGLQRLRQFIDALGHHPQHIADRIYCMYIYTHRHDLDPTWIEWLKARAADKNLSDYAAALCLEMCVEKKQADLAAKFATALRDRAQKTGNGHVFWTTAGFSRWMEDKFEITAAAMKALVAYDKDDPLVDGILGFFAATKRGDRWNSTKDTAMILFAMCDYLAKANYNPDAKTELSFSINGGEKRNVTFDDKLTKKVLLSGDSLKHGDNKLTFKTDMSGVMYRFVLRYWKVGRDIAPLDKGIKVVRNFYLLNDKGGVVRQLKTGDSVPRGSYLLSEVVATNPLPHEMRYVLLENPKPATAEVLPVDDPRFVHNQGSTAYVLREERLSSVAFHHEQTGNQINDRCVLLAELAGDFLVPPAFVELMYQTETRGHSGSFVLKVVDEK